VNERKFYTLMQDRGQMFHLFTLSNITGFAGVQATCPTPKTVSFNSGIATGSLQESGIEKDDIQTMFNVLDANNSGEAPLWLHFTAIWANSLWVCFSKFGTKPWPNKD
jgi:hypothetical protein